MYKDKASSKGNDTVFGFGEVLLLLSLCMDGLTGAVQVSNSRSLKNATDY